MPRRHAADIWDIGRSDAARLMEGVHDVAALLQERLSPDGMTLFQANRPAGWQTVFHIHVHLVPRHHGDPLTVSWQPRPASEAELDEAHGRIRALRRLVDRGGVTAPGDRAEQPWLDGGHRQAES